MMDNISWNNPPLICSSSSDNLHEPEFVYRAVSSKAEIMDEALLRSLDPHGTIWHHEMNWDYRETEEDYLQKQEEELFLASSSHQLLPLPLTTSSSSDMEVIRTLKTFTSSCENASSGLSQNYPDSFCNNRTETVHRKSSIPKPAMKKYEESRNPLKFKKAKMDCSEPASISFRGGGEDGEEIDSEAIAQVKEIIYIAAALRPVIFGVEEAVEKPRRKNLKISSDPQTAAARHRRERISDKLRVLQRLVPGGRKMDTASMLDEAANYLKFLKAQVTSFEKLGHGDTNVGHMKNGAVNCGYGMLPFPLSFSFYPSPKQTCIFPLQNP